VPGCGNPRARAAKRTWEMIFSRAFIAWNVTKSEVGCGGVDAGSKWLDYSIVILSQAIS
jgi:hypothetical protein